MGPPGPTRVPGPGQSECNVPNHLTSPAPGGFPPLPQTRPSPPPALQPCDTPRVRQGSPLLTLPWGRPGQGQGCARPRQPVPRAGVTQVCPGALLGLRFQLATFASQLSG